MKTELSCIICGEKSTLYPPLQEFFCPCCGCHYRSDNGVPAIVPAGECKMPPDPDLIASIKQFREEQEHEEQRLLTRHTARLKAWKSAAISLAIVGHALLIAFLTLFYKGMLSPGYASATVLGLMICAVILSFLFPKKKNTPGAREENDAVFPEDKQLISVVAALACEAALSTAVFFGFKLVIRILVNYGMFP